MRFSTDTDTLFSSYKQHRMVYHILFWIAYYFLFSFIWTKEGDYSASFGLEFVLLPIRIGAVYIVIYYLIPRLLLKKKLVGFIASYLIAITVAGVLQRIFIYHYNELLLGKEMMEEMLTFRGVLRAIILVNSTVILLSAVKMYLLWYQERQINADHHNQLIKIKSDNRTYFVNPSEILYVESYGNTLTIHLDKDENKTLTTYSSLKVLLMKLPSYFDKVHKSFIINKRKVTSFSSENVEIKGTIIPIGRSVRVDF